MIFRGTRLFQIHRFFRPAYVIAVEALLFVAVLLPLRAGPQTHHRRALPDSIREVPAASAQPARNLKRARPQARIERTQLEKTETAATLEFQVTLKMRNFDALQARIAAGEVISPADMAANYWPLRADYEKVLAWLKSLGVTITRTDPNRLSIFASGKISALAEAFGVSFARVKEDGAEFTSAISAPNVPDDIADLIVGINGLQPHIRPRLNAARMEALTPMSLTTPNAPPFLPAEISKAYNATSLPANGSGQIIAIVNAAYPKTSDLTAFWSATGISQSASNVTTINVGAGPVATPDELSLQEACIDVEWASAMAPAARIRVYGISDLSFIQMDQAYQTIYNDLTSYPGMHQLSLSYGAGETYLSSSALHTEAQYFANLASAGVSIFAASGDVGSTPDENGGSTGPVQAEYPASDPSVTAVGGTSLMLASSTGSVVSETVWSSSGGGISTTFARPSWQTGTGVIAGTKRLEPDVAMVGDPNTGLYLIYNGSPYRVGGTSVGAPVWAGVCALLNQTRTAAGSTPLGLLGPKIYPLLGTAAFRDITNGSNGTYSATAGYDLCTGIGVPNFAAFSAAIAEPPTITTQPGDTVTTLGGSVTFSVTATGNPTSYQWYYGGSAISTATGSSLTLSNVQTTNAGSYYVIVANAIGSTRSSTALLTVLADAISSQTVTAGHAVTLVAGTPGNYQWQISVNGGATWANLSNNATYSGATTNSLTITGATAAMNGFLFRFTTTGAGGGTSVPLTLHVSSASLPNPVCVAIDGTANLYVGDASLNTISIISPANLVTNLAGRSGSTGSTDGVGAAASFNQPSGLVSSTAGVLSVSDTGNATIRRIAAGGSVTTLAGSPSIPGHIDATGAAASFGSPVGLALDAAGNLYVADATNNIIREVAPDGVVTTVAGSPTESGSADGTRATARFNHPTGIAINTTSNIVYVADTTNNTIRAISSSGEVTTLAGLAGVSGSRDGTGTDAEFNGPTGLAIDSAGNLYVADTGNSTIRKITAAGAVTTFAGLPGFPGLKDGTGTDAWFNQPKALVADAADNLYVADTGNAAIRLIRSTGNVTTLNLTSPTTTVTTSTVIPSSGGGGGGGGGSLATWSYAALLTLCLLRLRRARH